MANVNVLTNTVAAAGIAVVPVKSKELNQLLVVIVGMAAPLVIVKFGALVAVPPALDPNWNDLATARLDTNPPVPVRENPVAVAMANTIWAAVVCVRLMLFDPNAIARVLVLSELKMPVVRSLPLRSRVPAVSVVVAVAISDWLPPKVSVPPEMLTPKPPNCLLN